MPPLIKRLRTIFRRTRMERELDAELRFHLDMLAAQNVARGMSPQDARRAARQTFGGVEQVKDEVRDTWIARVLETAAQDVRYGLRSLRSNPGYSLAVIATMALGIGANTAIFSVVNAVVLQPLPYERGDDLVHLRQPRDFVENSGFSINDIADIRRLSTTLDAVVEYHGMYFILLGGEEPERVETGVVSWDYFDALGIKPIVGRPFRAKDDDGKAPAVLMLGYDYWQRTFNGDPEVVGRVFEMNDRPHTVVGILPDVPMYPQQNDVYMPRSACPFRMNPEVMRHRGHGMASAFGRRQPGVTLEQTEADMASVAAQLQRAYPVSYPVGEGHRITSSPLRREFTRGFESTLTILLSTAGFVLLIVCASVANLAVARTIRREREMSLRTALGASRGRLLRQLVTESLLLSLAGGVAGLALAFVGMGLLVEYVQRFTARASEIRLDSTVLLFTLAVSLATGLIAGSIPALSRRLARGRSAADLRSRSPIARRDLRRALIIAQVAASFMLLIGAGLMLRSLLKLSGVDPGFRTEHVLTMQIGMNFTRYSDERARAAYLDRLGGNVRALPGVKSAGASGVLPFSDNAGLNFGRFMIEGQPIAEPSRRPRASVTVANGDYFRAIDIPLVRGRLFSEEDTLDAPEVAIVNRSLAERHWPGQDAVGRRISPGDGSRWITIIGVIANVRQQLATDPVDEIYIPLTQLPYVTTNWAIRTTTDPEVLAPLLREAVRRADPDQPVHRVRMLDDIRAASLTPPRLTTILLALFAGLALVITATGIAGVIAFSVSQRTQEFGVRMALGARRVDVVAMIVREGLRLTLAGLTLGVVGAILLGGLLSSMLFRVEPTDGVTYVAVSSVLLAVAALACLVPAMRAASVDPMTALRTT
jgi:putative ABC transport system permease protein